MRLAGFKISRVGLCCLGLLGGNLLLGATEVSMVLDTRAIEYLLVRLADLKVSCVLCCLGFLGCNLLLGAFEVRKAFK